MPREASLRRKSLAQTSGSLGRIVSKDADMHDRSLLFGFPPKVIWIRLGNCSTAQVEELIRRERETIANFIEDDLASFLTIS